MAGREVNCEYCRLVVFEADRCCVGCGAPRRAFPDEALVTYERIQPVMSYSSEPVSWSSICSTAVNMCDSSTPYMIGSTYRYRSVEYST